MSGLDREQALATDPRAHAALSASAGTGKTHVLTSRVFRLLLGGAAPETILGLTFTKAAAANMAERIGTRLASWVRMNDQDLFLELQKLGEGGGPDQRRTARTLFARVLDAPGGIRVMTIHAFAQSLLAAFPAEAGITPGFQQIEGRAEQELQHRTLADLMVDAERRGDRALIEDIGRLSQRLGEAGAVKYLAACAARAERLERLNPATMEAELRRLLGVPEGAIEAILAEKCSDGGLDCDLLRELARANRGWGTKTGIGQAEVIDQFLAADADTRVGMAASLQAVFRTGAGTVRKAASGLIAHRADYEDAAERLADALGEVLEIQRSGQAASDMASGLRAGRAYAVAYNRAKQAQGLADFADLIGWTRDLLSQDGIGAWVRYKLDRRIDHILVDEAQDTNADQWAIVDALADDFFSGASEAEERHRTLLIVGDFKQAIFRFQGTDPREFEKARLRYRGKAEALIRAEEDSGTLEQRALRFHDLGMNRSFRSAQAVLDAVDATIAAHGWDLMGLPSEPLPHVAARRELPGSVELWAPFRLPEATGGEEPPDAGDGEETWIDLRERKYADALAAEVKRLLDSKAVLASTGKPVTPGDILVLVRSRRSLSALIVARLFEAKVPVGGVDRLQLHAPLAVRDLLAAMRFSVQPLDDLNLAALLVSPLIGWSQHRLMAVAAGRAPGSLWRLVRTHPDCAEDAAILTGLLNDADFLTPARFLEKLLSGPLGGRRKLFGRLSMAARDPVDELINTALAFEREEGGSFEHFLAWFARGDVEVKGDPDQANDDVRVMTVHGAKGLEAPVVIIADAHLNPDDLGSHDDPVLAPLGEVEVPLSRSGTRSLPAKIAELHAGDKRAELLEHMRLLYVAMTRAIDRLVVAGMEPARGLKPNSWHVRVEEGLRRLGAQAVEDLTAWGPGLRYARAGEGPARARGPRDKRAPGESLRSVPDWALRPAPVEETPPRPLAPSAIARDDVAALPPSPAMRAAAQRGTWVHALLERLVDVAPERRREAALGWLERSAGVDDAAARCEIADQVCGILSDPAFAAVFGPGSLGEAPLAATLPDGRVIAGTMDRLLVEERRVSVVDFKTGRVPANAKSIPAAHRAQMAAYAAALAVIFPGREVRSALLYTAGPAMFELETG